MGIKKILRMGDPRLLTPAKTITEFGTPNLREIISDLWDTMHHANGAGLAAPQIGLPLQIVVFGFVENSRYPDAAPIPETVLINPHIEPLDNMTNIDWEGCLSVPGLRGAVSRNSTIRYTAMDIDGKSFSRVATNFHARVVQHECDHLKGVLYPMRISDMKQFGFAEEINN